MGLGLAELILIVIVVVPYVLGVVGGWKAAEKAGYSGALGLLMLVPLLNLVVVFAFGVADWPVLRKLRGDERSRLPPEAFRRG